MQNFAAQAIIGSMRSNYGHEPFALIVATLTAVGSPKFKAESFIPEDVF